MGKRDRVFFPQSDPDRNVSRDVALGGELAIGVPGYTLSLAIG
jgi:hypothetical protein